MDKRSIRADSIESRPEWRSEWRRGAVEQNEQQSTIMKCTRAKRRTQWRVDRNGEEQNNRIHRDSDRKEHT
jgi:hypothetical protein